MSALAVFVWVFGLVGIITGSMWADQKTRLPFWAILGIGLVLSVLLGQLVLAL